MARIDPEFYIDYHSYANLVLYPVGWQVETYGGDSPLMEALAGTDQVPSVAGDDPDVGGELYTTNGENTDTMYLQENVMGYTVELDGGAGSGVGGRGSGSGAGAGGAGGSVCNSKRRAAKRRAEGMAQPRRSASTLSAARGSGGHAACSAALRCNACARSGSPCATASGSCRP
jgi:hypothetical protein